MEKLSELELRLSSLTRRLEELERRVELLERRSFPPPPPAEEKTRPERHFGYLERTIAAARREYQQEL